MSNALATVRETSTALSREQIQLIKDTIAKEATDDELRQFVAVCDRLGLDPFAKQIYLVRRWDKQLGRHVAQSQVSIDGFRVVAERSGQYRGQTAPQWCGWDGQWRDVWLDREPPAAARIGIWREGYREPLYRTANLTSFVQTTKGGEPAAMWRTMPEVMLLKCAEAQALRAAFPNHLGGVYATEEMGQAQNDEQYIPPPAPQRRLAAVAPPPDFVDATHAIEFKTTRELPPTQSFGQVFETLMQGPPEPSEGTSVAELFGNKLRAQKTEADLVQWMREVIASEFEESTRKILWRMFRHHCLALRHDPNLLARKAQAKAEVNHG
jgi:phage recombination protein Bet